jgi:hypothetical protein
VAPRFGWCPIEIQPLFSSAWFQAMQDFQRGWYLCLLLRAWERQPSCQLPNTDAELRVLAGASDDRRWQAHKKLVLDRFVSSTDGRTLTNTKLLEVYQHQVQGYEKRSRAGAKGGNAKAAKIKQIRSNATAMPEHSVASASKSNSGFVVSSGSVPNYVDMVSENARAPARKDFSYGRSSGPAQSPGQQRTIATKQNIVNAVRSHVSERTQPDGAKR